MGGLSVMGASLEGRIYREVTAVLPIPSSVKSIKDLFNEVPHNLEYTDKLFVYMLPKSLLGGAYAQFEINAKFTPSEFSQVSVDIGDSLEDALVECSNRERFCNAITTIEFGQSRILSSE